MVPLSLILMIVCPFVVFVVVTIILYWKHRKYRHIPGPPRESFWLGHLSWRKRLGEYDGCAAQMVHSLSLRYGHTFVLWFYHRPVVCTVEPKTVRELLVSSSVPKSKQAYSRLTHLYNQRFLGQGLVTETNHKVWRERRNCVNQAFTSRFFPFWLKVFQRHADMFVQRLSVLADGTTEVCLYDEIQEVTMNVISQLGFNLDTTTPEAQPFHIAVRQVVLGLATSIADPVNRLLPWRQREFKSAVQNSCRFLRETGRHLVNKRRKKATDDDDDEGGYQDEDFLTFLMRSCGNLDNKHQMELLLDDFVTFFIAGQETTANLLSFVFLELGRNPHVTDRLVEEIENTLEDPEQVTYEDLSKLNYMDQVIREALRLYPSVPTIYRTLPSERIVGGFSVPAGTDILLSSYASGRYPDFYGDNSTFDPDRQDQEGESRAPTVFPFSLGPRSCIGQLFAQMEMKVILLRFLQSLTIQLIPGQSSQILESTTLRPKDGVRCTLTRRTF